MDCEYLQGLLGRVGIYFFVFQGTPSTNDGALGGASDPTHAHSSSNDKHERTTTGLSRSP